MSLEKQRNDLLDYSRSTSVSKHCQKQYDDYKTGKIVLVHGNVETMLKELDELSKQTSYDEIYFKKLGQFDNFDNQAFIENFKQQFKGMFNKIGDTGKQDEIQAIFIGYDFYYHFQSSCISRYRLRHLSIFSPTISGNSTTVFGYLCKVPSRKEVSMLPGFTTDQNKPF